MSFDTKYRPQGYDDVLGQEASVKILRGIVREGKAYHQSYLFAGAYGSGKTTLSRILARAMLCHSPTSDGDPCDNCISCESILKNGSSDAFIEVDAATNSGKSDIKSILESIDYATFGGSRRLYLFDESHQLSRDALDALLKPMEENIQGSPDKRLVCIFCTTEPEKMRATVLSRCAPAFVIKPVTPEIIATRLAWVCEQEGIEYDPEVLPLIAQMTECHIRDALKAIEGVAMTGKLDKDNVGKFLHLDVHDHILSALSFALAGDPVQAMDMAARVCDRMSPGLVYKRLAEVALLAYRFSLSDTVPIPMYWDREKMTTLTTFGVDLLRMAEVFAKAPQHATSSILACDVAVASNMARGTYAPAVSSAPVLVSNVAPSAVSTPFQKPAPVKNTYMTPGNVYIDPRGVGKGKSASQTMDLSKEAFQEVLGKHVAALQNSG